VSNHPSRRHRWRSVPVDVFRNAVVTFTVGGDDCPTCRVLGIHVDEHGIHETESPNSERAGVEHPTLSAINTECDSEDHDVRNDI
jgi:hypothetical protein